MAEKKLTPIQKAIEHIRKSKEANIKTQDDLQYNNGINSAIKTLQSLLPKEKEFAKEMFEAGKKNITASITNPKFDELFKQYEP